MPGMASTKTCRSENMKVLIQFAKLRPNPFRDFAVDPIDGPGNDDSVLNYTSAVTKLKASIEEDGFWGGVVVRESPVEPGAYEIAAGHHRIEAAKLTGLTKSELTVLSLDDDGMVRIYGRENATQRGTLSSAVMGTVAAALKLVLRQAAPNFGRSPNGVRKDQAVGRVAILAVIGKVPGMNKAKIDEQLAILKSSGDYRRIVDEVLEEARLKREELDRQAEEARVAAEKAEAVRADAERKRRDAQESAAKEQRATEKRAAEKRAADAQAAEERAKKRAEIERRAAAAAKDKADTAKAEEKKAKDSSEKADDPKFDKNFDYQGVSKWLKNDNQIRAFRKWALGAGIQPYLPVSSQAAVAEALARHAVEYKIELSAAFISQKATEMLTKAKGDGRRSEKANTELKIKSWNDKVAHWSENFSRGCRTMIRAGTELADLRKTQPTGAAMTIDTEFRASLTDARDVINRLYAELYGKD